MANLPQPRSTPQLEGAYTASRAEELLALARGWAADPAPRLAIDCTLLDRLDFTAIQVLLVLRSEVIRQGRSLLLVNVAEPVQTTLAMAGLLADLLP